MAPPRTRTIRTIGGTARPKSKRWRSQWKDPEFVILMNDLADDYDRLWLTERPTGESHPHKKANRARRAAEQSGG
jgi:hypothetical protein